MTNHRINLLESKFAFFSSNKLLQNSKKICVQLGILFTCLSLIILALDYYFSEQIKSSNQKIQSLRQFAALSVDVEKNYQKILASEAQLKQLQSAPVTFSSRYRKLIQLANTSKIRSLSLRESGEFAMELSFTTRDDFQIFAKNIQKREMLKNDFISLNIPALSTASESAVTNLNIRGIAK